MSEWRTIAEAPAYEVSEDGQVRRLLPGKRTYPGRPLRLKRHHFGYSRAALTIAGKNKTFEVHVLVATAFHGPKPFSRAEVRHLDGDPTNNHWSNLRWATHKENEADKLSHGTSMRGERNVGAKLTEEQVREIRRVYPLLKSESKTAALFGVRSQAIGKIVRRQRWAHVAD